MRSTHVPVAILGAGLAGLSAAERLARKGVPRRVFERNAIPGGLAVTLEDSGYRFDRTGHLLHLRSAELRAEVLEWLDGDCLELERKSRIWSHGVYTRYPFQAHTFGLPKEVAYECVSGFVRAHFADKPATLGNFEEFCLAHFGPGISRHFMLPYNRRLWGVPAHEINAEWCARFVPLPKLEDVLRGALGVAQGELGYNAEFLYPRRGIGELTRALAKRAGPLELAMAPKALRVHDRTLVFERESVHYEQLVSTLPLPSLLDLCDRLPAEVEAAKRRLRATSLYYVDLALTAPPERDFHWVYVPEERYPFYRVGSYSNFSPDMAPPGCGSLYVELCDREKPELNRLLPRLSADLTEMGLLRSPSDVRFARLRHIRHAYVIYDHARSDALSVIQPFLESIGVISTGRYGGWNHSSMEDALLFGRDAARRIAP